MQKTPPPIIQLVADVPPELSAILDRMLAKNPADRFSTPAEVAKILEPFCAGANLLNLITHALSESPLSLRERARVRAGEGMGTQSKPLPAPSRRRSIPILIAVAVAFMAAGFALGVIIHINKDGKETTLNVPSGSDVRVGEDGNADVTLPGQAKPSIAAPAPNEKATPWKRSVTFRTTKITRGDIVATVSATGTIEPAETVDVSAQVSARIVSFGDDPRGATDPQYKGKPIDYNSPVEEGTVLARIDDTMYKLRVEQEEANYKRTEFTYTLKERQEKMGTASLDELGAAEAAFDKSKVALKEAKINLENTVIKSPVNGVIIARRVNIGQNAGPDPNSPSMFLIAKDLKKMQIWAAVNEADIGRIRDGMTASFTVDAFPNEVFKGTVVQIRKDAQMTQNVVVFTVVLAFDNSDLKLMPYMTANLRFEIDTRKDVFLVPNSALRWKPTPELVAEGGRPIQEEEPEGSVVFDSKSRKPIWVKAQDDKHVRPIEVKTGLTDGATTEISGPDVKEGMEVVDGQIPQPRGRQPGSEPSNKESENPAEK